MIALKGHTLCDKGMGQAFVILPLPLLTMTFGQMKQCCCVPASRAVTVCAFHSPFPASPGHPVQAVRSPQASGQMLTMPGVATVLCYAACSAVLCCSTQKRSIIKLWVQVHESTCCCINKLSSDIEEFMPDFTGTNKTDGRQISEQCSTCFMFHVSIHSSAIHVCDDLMKAQLLLVWNCFHGRLALQQKKHNRWLPRAAKY